MSVLDDRGLARTEGADAPAWMNVSGLVALFAVTVRRLCRAKRLLSLALLYLLPSVLVIIARSQGSTGSTPREDEFYLLWFFLPQVIVPFSALLFASGLIQDEVEEQTLTYLLIRPLPRWAIYLTKLAASIAVTAALATVCIALNELVVYWGSPELAEVVPRHTAALAGLYLLSLVTYNAIFGFVGLLFRKSLPIGVIYIIVFEGFFASFDFIVRRATVMYYYRVLTLRTLGADAPNLSEMKRDWAIDLANAPSTGECLTTLLVASLVFAIASAWLFTVRELRVKTPEAT
jgi:ABC-2 type transport system permease protein